jgi:hypothetical protein
MNDSMAAILDRLREAAAAHDRSVGPCAVVPVGPIAADPQTQATGPATGQTDRHNP